MVLLYNPVPTEVTIVCAMTHTAVLVIQLGKTALDKAREGKQFKSRKDEREKVFQYLEAVGK